MIPVLSIIFWIAIGLVLWSYVFYPVALNFLAGFFGRKPSFSETFIPSVAILVPAYNEESVIARKIENLLALDWPADKLSIWIGSDQSGDRTEEIVRELAAKDPRIHLWRSPDRGGKTQVINRLLPQIENGELILFTDANTMHNKNCIRKMAGYFFDDSVGAIAGNIKHDHGLENIEEAENNYRSFEVWQKINESLLHSCISAFGGFYMLRKSLFKPIPENAYSNDDVLIPMNVIRSGKRVFFEPSAVSHEDFTGDLATEFRRRIRIGAGNFQSFSWLPDFLNPLKGWPMFCYFSHKVIRWFSPILLLISFVNLAILSALGAPEFYMVLFTIASAGSLISIIGWRVLKIGPLRAPYYFLAMNVALLMGLVRFTNGIKSAAWGRTQRS